MIDPTWAEAHSTAKLISMLGGNTKERREAVRLLEMKNPQWKKCQQAQEAVPVFISRLTDTDSDLRLHAVIALRLIGDERAIGPLVNALGAECDENVSSRAKAALDAIEPTWANTEVAQSVAKNLVRNLPKAADKATLSRAAYVLQKCGIWGADWEKQYPPHDVAPTWFQNKYKWGWKQRQYDSDAITDLEQLGTRWAVRELIKTVEHQNARAALTRLSKRLPDTEPFRDIDFSVFQSKPDLLRQELASMLGEMSNIKPAPLLIHLLQTDPHCSVRWAAARALGNLADTTAIEPLVSALADRGVGLGYFPKVENLSEYYSRTQDGYSYYPSTEEEENPMAKALVRIGPVAIETIVAALSEVDEKRRGIKENQQRLSYIDSDLRREGNSPHLGFFERVEKLKNVGALSGNLSTALSRSHDLEAGCYETLTMFGDTAISTLEPIAASDNNPKARDTARRALGYLKARSIS